MGYFLDEERLCEYCVARGGADTPEDVERDHSLRISESDLAIVEVRVRA